MIEPAAVHLVLPGEAPSWTGTGIEICRGDRVALLGSGHISWSVTHWGGPNYHL